MKRKGSFIKVWVYTLTASIFIFGGGRSYRCSYAKIFEKIDIQIESSMQRISNCVYINADSTRSLYIPKQPPKTIGIFIQPRVLKLNANANANANIFFSWISLPEEYDPHAIINKSIELSVLSCPKCKIIYPAYQFPVHGKYLTVFLRKDLLEIISEMDLSLPTKLNVKVYGEMNDGTSFEGLGSIWITKQHK
jgi:hypothetical protein